MCDWLDTRTREILQGVPPTKLAPADAAGFSLVLLDKGSHPARTSRAVARIAAGIDRPSLPWPKPPFPVVITNGLTIEEALFGQFELISCDSISVFLRDEIVSTGLDAYLLDLYYDLRHSHEFEVVTVHIRLVPHNEEGDRFLDQFLGIYRTNLTARWKAVPATKKVTRKKARIMAHWGAKMGVAVVVDDG